MKNSGILLFVLLFLCFTAQAQPTGPINQYNDHHKKQGYWKVYFDEHLFTSDSANALYFGYSYYINGKPVMECINLYGSKKNPPRLEHEGQPPIKGQPVAIDGLFRTYDEAGLTGELLYKDGICLKAISYFSENKKSYDLTDFTQHCPGSPYSFRHQVQNSDGVIQLDEWFVPNEKGDIKLIPVR